MVWNKNAFPDISSEFQENIDTAYGVSVVNCFLMAIGVLLFIPYIKLAPRSRRDYKARLCLVFAMVSYILVNIINAIIFLIYGVNLDNRITMTKTEESTFGGLFIKIVNLSLYTYYAWVMY